MKVIKSKTYVTLLWLTTVINITCSKNTEDKIPTLLQEKTYNPKSICDCNDDGIEILNAILIKRKQFDTIELLTADKKASEYINLLKQNWKTMQYKCLKLFGPALMKPGGCNQPQNIQSTKDQLFKLGVRT